jgi:hypothetical protein
VCQRTLHIDIGEENVTTKRTTSWWVNVDTSAYTPNTAWGALSWCHNTQLLLTPPELHMDRSISLLDWQFDVGCTLSALVQYTETDLLENKLNPSKPWERMFGTMSGTIGPLIRAGRDDSELLRAVWWSTRKGRHHTNSKEAGLDAETPQEEPSPPDVLTLLPEAYLRHVLVDYYMDTQPDPSGWRCAGVVSGFLVLPDDAIVPMRVPGLSASEELDAAKAMGARIWRLSRCELREATQNTNERVDTLKQMMEAPPEWTRGGSSEQKLLTPGMQINSVAGKHIFYTSTSTRDPLTGLALRWTFAPGGPVLPTLDVDNAPGGQQATLETVSKRSK